MDSPKEAEAKADELPSYDDIDDNSLGRMLSGPGIVSEVEFRRQEIVRSAIENHIQPVLRRQARYGIAKSTTVLQPCGPSDATSAYEKRDYEPEPADEGEIVSPAEENMELVKLRGDANTAEFWGQAGAAKELEHQLRDILCTSTIFEGVEFRQTDPAPAYQEPAQSSRRFGKSKQTTADVPFAHPPKNSSGVQLSVDREDIIIRTTSPFGLYETVTKPGLIVRIEVIC